MNVRDIIWLAELVEKIISKHGVSPEEVEELFANKPHFRRIGRGNVRGENLYHIVGQTLAGRYLIVVFIYKPDISKALVITARDMDRSEQKSYDKKR
jgi:uncharacterized protein